MSQELDGFVQRTAEILSTTPLKDVIDRTALAARWAEQSSPRWVLHEGDVEARVDYTGAWNCCVGVYKYAESIRQVSFTVSFGYTGLPTEAIAKELAERLLVVLADCGGPFLERVNEGVART